jgi:hypothetical protein
MTDPIKWQGSGSSPVGLTPMGYYDKDKLFVKEAPKIADYCARTLGYPVLDVELTDGLFYSCLEDSITEYSSQVHQFSLRENMISVQGTPISGSLTGKNITGVPIARLVEMSRDYGMEVSVGGNATLKHGYFTTTPQVSTYDLTAWAAVSESGNPIEIRKIFHDRTPATARFFDPFVTSGLGLQDMMNEMGFGGMAVASQFLMMPMYEDLLRIQAIELNDQLRRSQYSFEITNNQIRLFPIPSDTDNVWFDYYVVKDKFSAVISSAPSGSVVSDYSNAPFTNMSYSQINDIGRAWIKKYTAALAKETLGRIRSKYATIPIPGAEVTLDGGALKQEATKEKEDLIKQLQETLNETGKKAQLAKEKENSDNTQEIFKKVPLYIYIG